MPEQGGNLFLEFWVQADQEDRVDEAQDGACIETPRPPLRVPTDREEDAQRPPDENEGCRQDGHRLRHPIRQRALLISRPHLPQDQGVDDYDDHGWDDEDGNGSGGDPDWALVRQGAGGEVGDALVIPGGEEGEGVAGTSKPAGGNTDVGSPNRFVLELFAEEPGMVEHQPAEMTEMTLKV